MYVEVWKVGHSCNFFNNWSYAHVDLEIYPARIRPLADNTGDTNDHPPGLCKVL